MAELATYFISVQIYRAWHYYGPRFTGLRFRFRRLRIGPPCRGLFFGYYGPLKGTAPMASIQVAQLALRSTFHGAAVPF